MKILSKTTKKLNTNVIKKICKLKNSYWKFGMKSQIRFFKKNMKYNDIHNLIFHNNELIGYTALRNSKLLINKSRINYLRFDTLIISKKFRGRRISENIMNFNNRIIMKKKKPSLLICKKTMVEFYLKYSWKLIKKSKIKQKILTNKQVMIFNQKFRKNSNFYLYD